MELKVTKEAEGPLVLLDQEGRLEGLEKMVKRVVVAVGEGLASLECQVIPVFRERKDFPVVREPKVFLVYLEDQVRLFCVNWLYLLF